MSARIDRLRRTAGRVFDRIAAPLRKGEGPNKFRLSAAETATTTHDGDVGWPKRPPATVSCPRCESPIMQQNSRESIDCPRCVFETSYEDFPDLDLLYMTCPVCTSEMVHGQRHPHRFGIPEWATCNGCRYHWEFRHSYS